MSQGSRPLEGQCIERREHTLDFATADRTKRAVVRCMAKQGFTTANITNLFGCSYRCYLRICLNEDKDDLREDWEYARQWDGEIKVVTWYRDGKLLFRFDWPTSTPGEERGDAESPAHPDDESDIEDDLDCDLRGRPLRRFLGKWVDVSADDLSSGGSEYDPCDEESVPQEDSDSDNQPIPKRRTSARLRRVVDSRRFALVDFAFQMTECRSFCFSYACICTFEWRASYSTPHRTVYPRYRPSARG